MKKTTGFTLVEILISLLVVGILGYVLSTKLNDSGSSDKRVSNRLDLVEIRNQVTSYMSCYETLGRPDTDSLPVSCSGKTLPIRDKRGKTLKLANKIHIAAAKCETNPTSGEKGLVVSLNEIKTSKPSKDAQSKRDLRKVKKRAVLIEKDIFMGNGYFCGRYFEEPESEWKIAGSYTLNTYESSISKPEDKTCNQAKIHARCDKIFGGSCQAKCGEAVPKCKSTCNSRYPPKPYSCNCTKNGCSTCYDYSERNACYGRCVAKESECKSSECSAKLATCKQTYNVCKSSEKACRYPNPVTGDCSCPSVGGPIKEVDHQVTWSMSNRWCDHGYYGDSTRFPKAGDFCNFSGAGLACFNFKVKSMDPDQKLNAGCFCQDDNGVCPTVSAGPNGPMRRTLTCNKGSFLPSSGSGKWFGCGITTVACLVKFHQPQLKD